MKIETGNGKHSRVAENVGTLTVLIVLAFCIAGCLPSSSNVVVGRVASADRTATLSKRNSGAMSRGSTLVSVRENGVPDNDTHGLIVIGITGDKPVEMKWMSNNHLMVTCATCVPNDVNFEVVKSDRLLITYVDSGRAQ